jgi:MtrB/PioB family decaheme-associated outer membrane protein
MHRAIRFLLSAFGVLTTTAALAQTPAATPPPDAGAEETGSLFGPRWNEVTFGGRWTSVSGDEARFDRYQDSRSGLAVDGLRFQRESDAWSLQFGADHVGYRDQRYAGAYERMGLFRITGLWDQVPQFYSTDTKTAYTPIDSSPMGLNDATQLAIQQGQTNTRAYIPLAVQFDLRERRDIGNITARVTPTRAIDFTSSFTTTRHSGELPWGASFGFSNDVEVALPYDSRTNDFSLGAEWSNDHGMVRVAYDGSWFDNLDDTLVWDSPLRLTDIAGGPGRGQMALWPSNTAQTVSAAGYAKFARRTQVTGFLSLGSRNNNEPLLPFTINPAVVQLALPRVNTDGQAQIFSANVGLVSRPTRDWRFSARLRRYDYDNETPQAVIQQFINYDTSVANSATHGPELFAHDRTTFDADATWSGLQPLAITAGYTFNSNGYVHRIFESSDEQVFTLKADAVGSQWLTFRAHYDHAERTGDGLDEAGLVEIGEQPKLRHYDVADRNRDKFTGQVDITPTELVTVSVSAGLGNDDYPDSYFGLQEASFRVFTTAVDLEPVAGFVVGGSYSFEKYTGLQSSRTASPGAQAIDPRRDWTTDSTEEVNYFSLYLTPPRFGNTEARLSYDYARSEGRFVYGLAPNTTLPTPSPLPEVFNKLQQFRVDVRHRVSSRLRATLSYLYEPFDVYDFAFDPTVINSIIQPSSMVLGYVYRPYTAHSAVAGLVYAW